MEEFPNRCQDPLVSLSNGKRVCITRLIGAIELPFEHNNIAEFLIRRFVAMIPVLQIGDFCTKLKGIWLTNDVKKLFYILHSLSTSNFSANHDDFNLIC